MPQNAQINKKYKNIAIMTQKLAKEIAFMAAQVRHNTETTLETEVDENENFGHPI